MSLVEALETVGIHRVAGRTGGHTALVAACASTEVPHLEGSMNQYACDGLLTASASRAAAAR